MKAKGLLIPTKRVLVADQASEKDVQQKQFQKGGVLPFSCEYLESSTLEEIMVPILLCAILSRQKRNVPVRTPSCGIAVFDPGARFILHL